MTRHNFRLGVYALVLCDGHVVLIRKAKGPYTGQWDLPGGRIEFGESPLEALERELMEETGLRPAIVELMEVASNRFTYQRPDGFEEECHHVGILYRVTVDSTAGLKSEPDGLDSLGSAVVPLADALALDLTPFTRLAVQMELPGSGTGPGK